MSGGGKAGADKRIPSRTAFQLGPVQKHRFVVCFAHFLQLADKLVEQLLHRFFAPSRPKPRQGAMVRRFSVLQ